MTGAYPGGQIPSLFLCAQRSEWDLATCNPGRAGIYFFLTTRDAAHVVGFKKKLKILVVLTLVILQWPGGMCKGWVACRSQSFPPGE